MNKIINWINRTFSDCLGRPKRRCSGHEPLEEFDGRDMSDVMELKRINLFENPSIIQNAPIFDLNDDCVLQIFSHLSLYDLASVSSTCRHFQDLAKYKFAQQNKSKHLAFSDVIVFDYAEVKAEERQKRALDIVKAFASLIDTIIVLDIIYFRILPVLQAEMNLHAWSGHGTFSKTQSPFFFSSVSAFCWTKINKMLSDSINNFENFIAFNMCWTQSIWPAINHSQIIDQ